jgi:hypothetical protein
VLNNHKHLKQYKDKTWNGVTLEQKHAPYITQYLERMEQTIDKALSQYQRSLMVRVDLHYPLWYDSQYDDALIKRFIASLQSQVDASLKRKAKTRSDNRLLNCDLRYVWVKEQAWSNNPHYHMALFFNNDAFHISGFKHNGYLPFGSIESQNLMGMIMRAWVSALGIESHEGEGLVYIPVNPAYILDGSISKGLDEMLRKSVYKRLSYFAKYNTKMLGTGQRSFGASQR